MRPADISTGAAGTACDISAGVSDSLVTFPSAAGGVSVSRSDTNLDIGQVSDTAQTSATLAGQASGAVLRQGSDTSSHSVNVPATPTALTGQSSPTTDTAAITQNLCGAGPDRMSDSPGAVLDRVTDTQDAYQPGFDNVSATLASDRMLSAAVGIVRTHGHLSGSDMAKQMDRCGHPMSERTGLRWRDRAEEDQRQLNQTKPLSAIGTPRPARPATTATQPRLNDGVERFLSKCDEDLPEARSTG